MPPWKNIRVITLVRCFNICQGAMSESEYYRDLRSDFPSEDTFLLKEWKEDWKRDSLSNIVKIIGSKILKGLWGESKGESQCWKKTLFTNSNEIRVTFGERSQRTIWNVAVWPSFLHSLRDAELTEASIIGNDRFFPWSNRRSMLTCLRSNGDWCCMCLNQTRFVFNEHVVAKPPLKSVIKASPKKSNMTAKCVQRLLVWMSSISPSDQPRKILPCKDWVPRREKWWANSFSREDKLCFDM